MDAQGNKGREHGAFSFLSAFFATQAIARTDELTCAAVRDIGWFRAVRIHPNRNSKFVTKLYPSDIVVIFRTVAQNSNDDPWTEIGAFGNRTEIV